MSLEVSETTPREGDALVIVDVQNDFMPGGSLAVPHGDEVIPVLNRSIEQFHRRGFPIIATRDWHPARHCSFKAQGGIWPSHCVSETEGAQFGPGLELPPETRILSKAIEETMEAYSGFAGTHLADDLRAAGVKRIFVGGLATDYCVLNTVRDALNEGFGVVLLKDAIRAVDVNPSDGERAIGEMVRLGAIPIGEGGITE